MVIGDPRAHDTYRRHWSLTAVLLMEVKFSFQVDLREENVSMAKEIMMTIHFAIAQKEPKLRQEEAFFASQYYSWNSKCWKVVIIVEVFVNEYCVLVSSSHMQPFQTR